MTILLDEHDPISASGPVRWAVEQLRAALAGRGVESLVSTHLADAAGEWVVLIAGPESPAARAALAAAGVPLPASPEALALLPATVDGRRVMLACGSDERGVVYAVLELADRVACAEDVSATLRQILEAPPVVEQPANPIRGLMRLFTSKTEDLGWYHDRDFWKRYLDFLAAQRFNRFQLALGIGYDFARRMRDSYFYFAYPFLLAVPGYEVRAVGVSDAERERNLETLRFVARETKRRGLHFQLGLWAHVHVFEESPEVNHPIEGLDRETHAPYCRDAVRLLLKSVPEIDGLTLRVHGESGIPEGNYDFWRTLFSGIAGCGRRVEIDMHAKGIDAPMIDLALETGQPVLVSPKFWAEHMGLPYHQADIRAVEHPPMPEERIATEDTEDTERASETGRKGMEGVVSANLPHSPSSAPSSVSSVANPSPRPRSGGLMALSTGERRFTRYGYGDLLTEERRYGVLFRIWPGTHRLLLWGDPVSGRAYGRAFHFCGTQGAELFEPLSFSGRRGSGLPDGRNPYADETLRPEGAHNEWQKYEVTYRLWGRLLYNPDAEAETWRRFLRRDFGAGAEVAEAALSHASRILPLITTAHHPSAANNCYWPEIYTNMPIVETGRPHPYGDTASPKRFGNVSALDPALFSSVEEYVEEILTGNRGGRYSPVDVARWLEEFANAAIAELDRAAALVPDAGAPEFRRWSLDILIEAALGRFFAQKLIAAAGYTLFTRTGDAASLRRAVACYQQARGAWVTAIELAEGTYKGDLTFGPEAHLRGHWADRLGEIDEDLREMEAMLASATDSASGDAGAATAAERLWTEVSEPQGPAAPLTHTAPDAFTPGEPLRIEAAAPESVSSVRLHYRHVNQAERFEVVEMRREDTGGGVYRAEIPGDYTRSPFPLQYFFTLHDREGAAWLWPGLGPDLVDQPYFVVRAAR